MSKKIREEIEAFKKQNGNVNFTQKEMLWYLMSKVDNLSSHEARITNVEKTTSRHWKIIMGVAGATILFLINFIRSWFG